jgi:Trk K+ transport system NAD-binding subunit
MGTIGYQVMLALLKRGKEVAVIEKNESGRFVSEARNLGVPVIFGDAKLPQVLKQANIQKAKAIAIVTSDDLANLETALIANSEFHENVLNINKRLKVVLRVFDKSLGDGIARNFDIRNIYSASGLAAPYYVAAALNFEVVSTFYLDRQPFIVAKLVVKKDSVLDGITVNELYQKVKVSVLALVERDKEIPLQSQIEIKAEHLQVRQLEPTFHPTANRCLLAGDTIYFVGLYDRVISTYMLNKNEKDPIPGQK